MLKPSEVVRYSMSISVVDAQHFPSMNGCFAVWWLRQHTAQLRAATHQNTEGSGEDTQGGDWRKAWWNGVIVAWRLLWRQKDFPHQKGPFRPSLSRPFFLPVSAEHLFLDHFQPQPPQLTLKSGCGPRGGACVNVRACVRLYGRDADRDVSGRKQSTAMWTY